MANVFISIADETALCRFHRALTQAATVGSNMIRVSTKIHDDTVLKVVHTDCPWAIAVFETMANGDLK